MRRATRGAPTRARSSSPNGSPRSPTRTSTASTSPQAAASRATATSRWPATTGSFAASRTRPRSSRASGATTGVTLAAMSATGITAYWPMFEPRVPGFVHIPSPYPYRYEAPAGESQGIAAANELEQAILREGPDTVGMFLAEPVQGAGGVIVPQDDYFPRIREICDQYDVLFASDEVITGFGRTGRMFGLEHWGVKPDMIQFAKAITSGVLPARRHRDQRRDRGRHGRRGHPLDARLHVQRPPGRLCHRGRDARHHRAGRLPGNGRGQGQAAARPPEGRPRRPSPRRGRPRSRPHVRRGVRPGPGHQGGVRRRRQGRPPHQPGDHGAGDVLPGAGRRVLPRAAHHHLRRPARPDGGHPRGTRRAPCSGSRPRGGAGPVMPT